MLPCLLALTAALVSGRALALEGTVRFGGSGTDRLMEAVACGDGILAVGSTTSTDGDLSTRAREGKAGWAARISADGRLLWSVCTAHAGRDEMSAPYAHADGTFSAVLSGEKSGSEWLRISDRGKVLMRVAVPAAGKLCLHTDQARVACAMPYENDYGEAMLAVLVDHGDGMWCLPAMNASGEVFFGAAYPEPRDLVRVLVGGGRGELAELSTSADDGVASVYRLRPGDERSLTQAQVPMAEGKLTFALDAISFDDGSVLFSAQRSDDVTDKIFRVGCTGEVIFELDVQDNMMLLSDTAEGFAALDSDDVIFYDEDGHELGQRRVGVENMTCASCMVRMGDGVALLLNEPGTSGDTRLLGVERYSEQAEGEYDDALYTYPVGELLAAECAGAGVLLLLRETGGGERCVLVDEKGQAAQADAALLPAQDGVLALPDGRLLWQETDGGSEVVRLNGDGSERWRTRTPIHTAADRLQWLCAARTQEGGFLLGGRYLSQVEAVTEREEAFLQRSTDGLRCEAVLAELSAAGVLRRIDTLADLGSVCAILPASEENEGSLLCTGNEMTTSEANVVAALDGSRWRVLHTALLPENAFLLPAQDGGLLAAGTSRRNGRLTAVLERVPQEWADRE